MILHILSLHFNRVGQMQKALYKNGGLKVTQYPDPYIYIKIERSVYNKK